jgi:hypothetical protein
MKAFDDWEMTPNKMWLVLKTFIHGACTYSLVAVRLCSTSVQQSYTPTQNMWNILDNDNNYTNNCATTTMITQAALAATAGSMLGNTYAMPALDARNNILTLVINLLVANQQALHQHIIPLLKHMDPISFCAQPPPPARTFQVPHRMPFLCATYPTTHNSRLATFQSRRFPPRLQRKEHRGAKMRAWIQLVWLRVHTIC